MRAPPLLVPLTQGATAGRAWGATEALLGRARRSPDALIGSAGASVRPTHRARGWRSGAAVAVHRRGEGG